jgi:hypothetical protein
MYREGNVYLSASFPQLDYIEWCRVLPSDQRWLSSAATDALLKQSPHTLLLHDHDHGNTWPSAALYAAAVAAGASLFALGRWCLQSRRALKDG